MIERLVESLPVDVRMALSGLEIAVENDGEAPACVVSRGNKKPVLKICERPFFEIVSLSDCSPEEVLEKLILHELLHVLLDHFDNLFRKTGYDRFRMNVAADAVVNGFIPGFGDCFESFDPVSDRLWKGIPLTTEFLSVEDVYSLISVRKGSKVIPLDSHNGVEIPDPVWKRRIIEFIEDFLGDIDAGFLRHVIDGDVRRNWIEAILRHAMERVSEFSHKRPSRRYGCFPGKKLGFRGRYTVMVDASGSMKDEVLSKILGFIKQLEELSEISRVYSYDTRAYELTPEDLDSGKLKGGGGTSLKGALRGVRVDGTLIVITDGLDRFPEDLPMDSFVVVVGRMGRKFFLDTLEKLGSGRVFLDEGI